MRIIQVFLSSVLIFFILLSSVYAQIEINTYFIVDAVDQDNNPIEPDLLIFINITHSGEFLNHQHYMTLSEFNSFTTADWNPSFYPSGTVVELTASKDGFYASEKFIFVITENTPIEGLLFEHTFVLTRIGVVELPSFTENIQVSDRSFDITLSTSSQFNSIDFDSNSKSLIVELDEESESGSMTIHIPKTLMSGQFRIVIDNSLSEFVIKEQSDTYLITLEYSKGMHFIIVTSSEFYVPAVVLPQLMFDEFDSDVVIDDTFIITGKLIPISTVTQVNLVLQTPSGEESFVTIPIFADGTFQYFQIANQLGQWTISGNYLLNEEIIPGNYVTLSVVDDVLSDDFAGSSDVSDDVDDDIDDVESPEIIDESIIDDVVQPDDETPWLYYIAISLVSTIVAALVVFVLYVKLILPKKSDSGKSELKLSDILSRIMPKKTETSIDDQIVEEPSTNSKEEELRRKEEELKRKEEELLRKEQELEENKDANDNESNNDSQDN